MEISHAALAIIAFSCAFVHVFCIDPFGEGWWPPRR